MMTQSRVSCVVLFGLGSLLGCAHRHLVCQLGEPAAPGATSGTVVVLGAVNKPGIYPFSPGMTVGPLLDHAGGRTALAQAHAVSLRREIEGKPCRAYFTNDYDEPLPIWPGDTIYVPERGE